MRLRNFLFQKTHKLVITIAVVVLLTIGSLPFFSRDRVRNETIEASAMGTGTQLGVIVGVRMKSMTSLLPTIARRSSRPLKRARIRGSSTLSPK